MEDIDITSLLAAVDEKEAELAGARRHLESLTTTAQSADGLVQVTVGPVGAVTSVRLVPEAFRRSTPQYLAQVVTETVRRAAHQIRGPRKQAVALIAAAVQEMGLSAGRRSRSASSAMSNGVEAFSTDRRVRATVDMFGIVDSVQIAPDGFRNTTPDRLAASIAEAAHRADRAFYEARSSELAAAVEHNGGAPEPGELEDFLNVAGGAPEPPPATPPPPPTPAPAPAPPKDAPHVIPGTRKPNRDLVVGPSDIDDDDDFHRYHNEHGWFN
ncbi:MAG: YbaB/EbfC family nucleoid-associated protein [Nocardia sp.]|nr:YbaB/EbfC family nucleoid-associated protein [Nocardia sp.]